MIVGEAAYGECYQCQTDDGGQGPSGVQRGETLTDPKRAADDGQRRAEGREESF